MIIKIYKILNSFLVSKKDKSDSVFIPVFAC